MPNNNTIITLYPVHTIYGSLETDSFSKQTLDKKAKLILRNKDDCCRLRSRHACIDIYCAAKISRAILCNAAEGKTAS